MTNQHTTWTDRDDARLRAAWEGGTPDAVVAATLSRSPKAVKRRRQTLRLVKTRLHLDHERLAELVAAEVPTRQIAREVGATFRTVQELRYRMAARRRRDEIAERSRLEDAP